MNWVTNDPRSAYVCKYVQKQKAVHVTSHIGWRCLKCTQGHADQWGDSLKPLCSILHRLTFVCPVGYQVDVYTRLHTTTYHSTQGEASCTQRRHQSQQTCIFYLSPVARKSHIIKCMCWNAPLPLAAACFPYEASVVTVRLLTVFVSQPIQCNIIS